MSTEISPYLRRTCSRHRERTAAGDKTGGEFLMNAIEAMNLSLTYADGFTDDALRERVRTLGERVVQYAQIDPELSWTMQPEKVEV